MKEEKIFDTAINKFTLKFNQPHIEKLFEKYSETRFQRKWPRIIMIIIVIVGAIGLIVRGLENIYVDHPYIKFGILLLSCFGEYFVHFFYCLRYLRGWCIGAMLPLYAFLSDQNVFDIIALRLGNLTCFIFGILYSEIFSLNWMVSGCIQIVASLEGISINLFSFWENANFDKVIGPLLNFCMNYCLLPLWFYYLEYERREIAFLSWKNRKEKKFWKKLAHGLPVGIILINNFKVEFFNTILVKLFNLNDLECTFKEDLMRALDQTYLSPDQIVSLKQRLLQDESDWTRNVYEFHETPNQIKRMAVTIQTIKGSIGLIQVISVIKGLSNKKSETFSMLFFQVDLVEENSIFMNLTKNILLLK